jgi:hypothetical protein
METNDIKWCYSCGVCFNINYVKTKKAKDITESNWVKCPVCDDEFIYED